MKKAVGRKSFLLITTVTAVVILATLTDFSSSRCDETYRTDTVIHAEGNEIRAEVADDTEEHSKGLSGRGCIAPSQGMLFIFERPGYYNFWMKDMAFPIDIIWMDSQKRVISVTDSVQPSTYPDTFASTDQTQYVLELKAGQAAKLGITEGDKLSF